MNNYANDDRLVSCRALLGRLVAARGAFVIPFAIATVILLATLPHRVSAQDRDYAPRSRASALAKLDRFQQSVKDRIRAAFSNDETTKQPQLDQQGPHESVAQTASEREVDAAWSQPIASPDQSATPSLVPPPNYQPSRYQESPAAYSRYLKPEPGGFSRAISHRRTNQVAPPEQIATNAERSGNDVEADASMEQLLRQSPTQRVQYEQEYSPAGRFGDQQDGMGPYASGSGMPASNAASQIQPPIRQQPAIDSMGPNPAFGQSSVQSSQVPSARGAILGGDPMTATQHALRLIEENGDLKAKLATSLAEVSRLREKLSSTEYLLKASNEAVTEAQDEMDRLTQDNRQLQRRLSESEAKYNRYLRETDRMLESIREELDEVLVRELSSGNK